jgi:Family of unknown function (DUF6338)
MPTTIQAFIVLIFGIAPGFVGIRGYSRRRYKTVPDRDLYALAGAAVVSAIWMAVVWLPLDHFGNPLKDWGVIPFDGEVVEENRVAIGCLALGVLCAPYALDVVAALTMDRLEGLSRSSGRLGKWAWKKSRKTGFFKPPTAWDRAWLHFTRSNDAREVLVQMEDGLLVRGGFGDKSQADLSPNSPRVFLESGYGYRFDENGQVKVEGIGDSGVYLPGDNINAIYFRPVSRADADESDTKGLSEPKPTGGDRATGVG